MSTTLLLLPTIILAVGVAGGWVLRSIRAPEITERDWRLRMANRDRDLRVAQDRISDLLSARVGADAEA